MNEVRQALQLIPATGNEAAAAEAHGRFVKVKSHLAVHSHNPGDDCAQEIYFIAAAAADIQCGVGGKQNAAKTRVSLHVNDDVVPQTIIHEALGTEILVVDTSEGHRACVDVEPYARSALDDKIGHSVVSVYHHRDVGGLHHHAALHNIGVIGRVRIRKNVGA